MTRISRIASALIGFGIPLSALAGTANAQVSCPTGQTRTNCAYDVPSRKVICECIANEPAPTVVRGNPTYQLVSILYVPPGKDSELKYGAGSSMGSRTEMMSTNEGGIIVQAGGTGVDLEGKWTKGFKNGTAMTWQKSQSTTIGLSGNGNNDTPSHVKDAFQVWINPVLAVTRDGRTNQRIEERMEAAPDGVRVVAFTAEQLMDVNKVRGANELAAWNKMTASDRNAILATNPFLTNAPLDPARFRKMETLQLLGPDNAGDLIPSRGLTISYDKSNDTMSGRSNTFEGTALFGADVNVFGLKANIKTGVTYSYTYEKMLTDTTGAQQSAELTLKTSTIGQRADVDVYMDAAFGTFATVSTNTYNVSDVPAIRGRLVDAAGRPRANELVTVPLLNGSSRRVITNAQGVYRVDGVPVATTPPVLPPMDCNGALCRPIPQ